MEIKDKILIGVMGEKGSGKETVGDLIIKNLSNKKVERIRSSDVLGDTLKQWGIPLNRHNLQYLAIIMNKEFGPETLSNAVKKRMEEIDAEVIIFDGIRWPADIRLLRSFNKNKLIYVTASPEIRYERVKARKQKVGEGQATFEQFLEEEKAETEIYIGEIGNGADVKIDNSKGLLDLEISVKNFVSNLKI